MIDWSFISRLEGGQLLHGYVPKASHDGDKSGVTIATGIDLGYYSLAVCATLPGKLGTLLSRYIGLTGDKARAELARFPLAITQPEADAIEAPKRRELQSALSSHYLTDAAYPFEKIPDAAQTVLMSLTWQYGTPWKRTPHFWSLCCKRDWRSVIAALRDFRDPYSARRNREADYLEKHLGDAAQSAHSIGGLGE